MAGEAARYCSIYLHENPHLCNNHFAPLNLFVRFTLRQHPKSNHPSKTKTFKRTPGQEIPGINPALRKFWCILRNNESQTVPMESNWTTPIPPFKATGCKYLDPEGSNDLFIPLLYQAIYCSNMNAINAFEAWILLKLDPPVKNASEFCLHQTQWRTALTSKEDNPSTVRQN